jgi:hypothetical protein
MAANTKPTIRIPNLCTGRVPSATIVLQSTGAKT